MSISIAEDYAMLSAAGVEFYYGYEVTDHQGAWCFEAKFETEDRPIVLTQDDLKMADQWECVNGLLRGIEIMIETGCLVVMPRIFRDGGGIDA